MSVCLCEDRCEGLPLEIQRQQRDARGGGMSPLAATRPDSSVTGGKGVGSRQDVRRPYRLIFVNTSHLHTSIVLRRYRYTMHFIFPFSFPYRFCCELSLRTRVKAGYGAGFTNSSTTSLFDLLHSIYIKDKISGLERKSDYDDKGFSCRKDDSGTHGIKERNVCVFDKVRFVLVFSLVTTKSNKKCII